MKQITIRNFLSLMLITSLSLFILSCGSSKKTSDPDLKVENADEIEIKQFCTGDEYRSSDGFIRARFYGESNDMALSKKVAKSNTLEELGSKIEVTVKAVIDNYNSRRQKDINESVEQRYEELIRTTVKQKINGYKTVCEKVTKNKDGKYRTYLVYEIPVDNVLNPTYDKLSKDDELKVDYDYQKFKETFEEEMKNLESQK